MAQTSPSVVFTHPLGSFLGILIHFFLCFGSKSSQTPNRYTFPSYFVSLLKTTPGMADAVLLRGEFTEHADGLRCDNESLINIFNAHLPVVSVRLWRKAKNRWLN